MKRDAQPEESDWRDGFLFLGNHLALDFLNTKPVQHGEPHELLPDFSSLLCWFQAADLLSPPEASHLEQRWRRSASAQRALHAIRELREKIRSAVVTWEGGGRVDPSVIRGLNEVVSSYPMRTRLKSDGDSLRVELYFEAKEPHDLLAPLAHAATQLFGHTDRNRVRKCDQCVLHFLDVSKKGTRRWCSMRLCGNRQKVAAFAARRRRVHGRRRKSSKTSGSPLPKS